jgi:hypothetical protein
MTHRSIRWLITGAAILAGTMHVIWPDLAIDGITATLLLVAIVPWLQPLFKSVELPGGVKIEFQDLEKVAERANAAGLLAEPVASDDQKYSYQLAASADPNLALAGLRIELERHLEHLARSRGNDDQPRGIAQLLRYLNSRELIDGAEMSVLRELVGLLNSAVHGARVEAEAAQWAFDVGPRILRALDERASAAQVAYTGIADALDAGKQCSTGRP